MKKKILILGASSDMGLVLLDNLDLDNFIIGAHCYMGKKRLNNFFSKKGNKRDLKILEKNLSNQKSCKDLVNKFVKWSKGIDILVQLTGNVSSAVSWEKLKEKNWRNDIAINLGAPFFASQAVFGYMKKKGGKIILMSTASAKHGGGRTTMGYGVSKAGVEALTKGLAREGAKHNILVNALAPGLISTRFHKEKLGRSDSDMKKRLKLSKLKRIGSPREIAKLINLLISDESNYMTGEVLSVSGADWI